MDSLRLGANLYNTNYCMLNSAMEQIKKNWLIIVINTLIALLLVIFTASVNSKYLEAKEYKNKLENLEKNKVDKVDFQQKCDETKMEIDNLKANNAEILQKTAETLQEIVKQNATMQTDISWIKREIDRKTKN